MEEPALLRLWLLAALALGVALGVARAAVPEHRVLPELRVPAETGTVFVHELEREPFLEALSGSEDDDAPVTFRAHLRDHPDLPRWLRFAQRDPGQPGYLYGCPLAPELGTHSIQVLAYNRRTFATASQRLLITVTPAPGGEAPFQAEFLVGDRNVEELLPEAARETFLRGSAGVWGPGGALRLVDVTSALRRGGRVPLPIQGRREGVYVRVGSHSPFSPCLASAVSPPSRSRCRRGQRPLASCYDTFAPHFSIQWCNLTLLQLRPSPPPPGRPRGSGVLEGGAGFEPPRPGGARGALPEFLATLLAPLAAAALLCPLLAHLLCCRRQGREKRDLQTSDLQLAHHSSILGDARELRRMARSRDVPRPRSTLPMFNVRTGQRCDPLGNLRDPLGNLREPLGNLREPLGNLRDPLGNLREPLGNLREPLGNLRDPVGNLREPLGNLREPLGNLRDPLGNLREPLGNLREPLGNLRDPLGNLRDPLGNLRDPLGNLREPLGNLRDPLGNLTDPLGNPRDGARAPLLPQ